MLIFSFLLYFQNGLWINISLFLAYSEFFELQNSIHQQICACMFTQKVFWKIVLFLEKKILILENIFSNSRYILSMSKKTCSLIICIFHNFIGYFRRSCFTILIRRNTFILLRSININLLLKTQTSSNFIQPFKIMLTQLWWWKHGNEIQTKEIKFPLKTHFFVFTINDKFEMTPPYSIIIKLFLGTKEF